MSKLNSGKTITIKVNRRKRKRKEEDRKRKAVTKQYDQSEAQVSQDSIAETEAFGEAAASKELSDENFEWIPPEKKETNKTENKATSDHPAANGKTKLNLPKKPLIVAAIFAVILGTIFGLFMLKLVSPQQFQQAAQIVQNMQTNQATPAASNKNGTPAAASGQAFTLKPWTAYVVQGGVYATKESAKKAKSLILNKGIPAASLEMDGMQFIFIGVSNSMEEDKTLGTYLRQKGSIDVYSRTLAIPEKKLSNLTNEEKAFIKDAAALFPILTNTTANLTHAGSIPKNTLASITEYENNITKVSSEQIKNGKFQGLKTEITAAADLVKTYQKKSDQKTLAAAQQHLINFLTIYYLL